MDEQTLEKNDVLQELLKSEYDLAKHECEYYTQEFNKQDTVYGVYFAVFSVVIGAIYKIAETNNDQLELTNLAVILNQKIIIGGMILFLAFAYIYVFLVIMGNSYYLILYSEKIINMLNCRPVQAEQYAGWAHGMHPLLSSKYERMLLVWKGAQVIPHRQNLNHPLVGQHQSHADKC